MYKYASPYSTAAFLNRSKFSYKKYSKEGSEESLVIRDIIFHYPGLDSHSMCFWTWTDSRRGEWVDCGAGRSPYVGAEGPAVLDVEEKGVGDGTPSQRQERLMAGHSSLGLSCWLTYSNLFYLL